MRQLSKQEAIFYHLYPGILITASFILLTPVVLKYGYPPQASLLISIVLVALPVLLSHLIRAKKTEKLQRIRELNGYQEKLPAGKLILYTLGLVVFAFLIWGITQPLNVLITPRLFNWLPAWYTEQDMSRFSQEAVRITLLCNLLFNGILAPFIEEVYFRGYLMPRMEVWGKSAFVINALLFSLYHFWQPYIYLTLVIALLPMTYLVWKTKDLRLAILTHCLLNLTGALLSFAAVQS